MNPSRETNVLTAVVTLVDSLLGDFDVVELLTDLTEQCTRLLDVGAAGLLLAGARGDLHLLAATSKRSHDLEMFQLQADQGPCLDCFTTGQPVSVPDLQAERDRWPRFVAAATDAGVVSVHAVPLRAAGDVLGAMGLFSSRTGALGEADLQVAHTLAHVACVALLQEHSPTSATIKAPLRAALADRVVIDQATGFIGERLGVTPNDAFEILRRYARTHTQHLTDIAREMISQPAQRETVLTARYRHRDRPRPRRRGSRHAALIRESGTGRSRFVSRCRGYVNQTHSSLELRRRRASPDCRSGYRIDELRSLHAAPRRPDTLSPACTFGNRTPELSRPQSPPPASPLERTRNEIVR